MHPVARGIGSDAICMGEYQWMNSAQPEGNSPCLTVAYVEAACIGGDSMYSLWWHDCIFMSMF